jgi:hypothetical protein
VLDGVIVIATLILNPKARKRRKLEAQRAALDATVAQVNATQPLSLSPTIVEVEDGPPTSEKELSGGSSTSPVYKHEERKETRRDESSV